MRHWLLSTAVLLSSAVMVGPLASANTLPTTNQTPPPEFVPQGVASFDSAPAPFQSRYKVFRNGTEVGKGSRTLYTSSDGRLYFSSESRLKWFFLTDYRKEQTWVRLEQGKVLPLEYQYDRTGTGPDKFSHVIFNDKQQTLQELKKDYPLKMEWQAGLLDHLSYQLQIRLDVLQGKEELRYQLTYKGKLKEYVFEVVGEEILNLPIGQIKTLKLHMVRKPSSSRDTYIWLSKEHDYVLARIWQSKDGKEQADLQLSGFEKLETAQP